MMGIIINLDSKAIQVGSENVFRSKEAADVAN